MKSITVVLDDRVGLLADISYILGKTGITIEELSVDVVGKKAVVALTVNNQRKALDMLLRNGYETAKIDSIVIKLPNKPGELSKIAAFLSRNGINTHDMHMLSSDNNNSIVALMVDKLRKTKKILNHMLLHKENDCSKLY